MDFSDHGRRGRFLVSFDDERAAGFLAEDGQVITLESSGEVHDFFTLGKGLALGDALIWKSYVPEFVAAGWRMGKTPFPMALWDLHSGKKLTDLQGVHAGSLRGALRVDEKTLITWGRDFRVFLFDIESGEQIETFTTPVTINADGHAIVSSGNGEHYSIQNWTDYIAGKGAPGFNIAIRQMPKPNGDQTALAPISGPRGDGADIHKYRWNGEDKTALLRLFRELEGVEAGYSTSFLMGDGRVVIGATSYGAWESAFIWDGARDLTILIPGAMDANARLAVHGDNVIVSSGAGDYVFSGL